MCNMIRKMSSIVMIAIIMLSFVGCGNSADESVKPEVEDKTDVTFEGTNMQMAGIDGEICHFLTKHEKIYILTMDEPNEDEKHTQSYRYYSSDLDGQNVEMITHISTEQDIVSFCVDSMENIIYIANSSKEEAQVIELVKLDKQGTEILRSDITKIIKDDVQMISGIVSDATGQIILTCGERICFFDEQLQSSGECLTNGEYVIDMALTKNNQLVCVLDQLYSEVIDIKVCMLDIVKKQWGKEINIRTGEDGEQDCVFESAEYDFCYKGNNGINGYNVETGESTELINYDASYMTNADTAGMICAGEGIFIGKSENLVDQKRETNLISYIKKDMTKVSEKEAITFGIYRANPNIKSAIAKYNRNNPEYEIVLQEYFEMDGERLLTDIMAGKGQDIMDLSFFPLSVEQCISKGLIEDLTPYYEKDIEGTNSDMVDSVRKAMEKEGKIYYVAPSFSLTSVVAKTEVVGNKNGWNVSEFKETMEQVGEDVEVFAYEDTKISYLAKFINNNMEDYIDWEKGECNFDSDEFKYILSLCDERGLKEESNGSYAEIEEDFYSSYSRLRDGNYVLLESDSVDLYSIQLDRKAIGEEITYIGYPNKEKQGSYFRLDNKFAISSQSKVKEEAWQFVCNFMSVEYQKSIECSCCMPTSQVMFDNKLKALTATEAYVDEFGENVQPMEQYTKEWGDIEIVMEVPTQEDVEIYLDLINQTKYCVDSDMVVFNIIMEEAADYFEGRRRLDKTVQIIQERVETYVNEQR